MGFSKITKSFLVLVLLTSLGFFGGGIIYAYNSSVVERYLDQARFEEAIEYLKKELKTAPGESAIYADMGMVYGEMDNSDEAMKWLKEAIRVNPSNPVPYERLGEIYFDMEDFDEATRYYKEAMRLNPNPYKSYEFMGRIYSRQGKYEEAIKWFNEAMRINPDEHRSQEGIGRIYASQDKYEDAIKWYQESIKKSRSDRFLCAYEGLGLVYKKLGKASLAEKNFLKIVKINPFDSLGYYNLARYYNETARFDEAMRNIDKFLTLINYSDNEKRHALQLKGFILVMQKDYASAEKVFRALIKEHGENCFTLAGLGHIYNAKKEYKLARKYFEDALKLPAGDTVDEKIVALLGLGWVNANEGKHREAISCYEEILKEQPLHVLALTGMSNAYKQLGEYDKAKSYLNQTLKINPAGIYVKQSIPSFENKIVQRYLDQAKFEEAQSYLKEQIKINPGDADIYSSMGDVYDIMGNHPEAIKWYKESLRIEPDKSDAYLDVGRAYYGAGNYPEAIKWFKESLKAEPENLEAYCNIGDSFMQQKNFAEAIKWYKGAIRIEPNQGGGYYGLGRVYENMGNYDEAAKLFKEAIKIDPNEYSSLDALGTIYFRERKYDDAERLYKESIKKSPPNRFICPYEGLGLIYSKIGRISEAEENFLTMVRMKPNKYEGYYDLARYYYQLGKIGKARENIEKAFSFAFADDAKQKVLRLKGFILIMQQDYVQAEDIFNSLTREHSLDSATLAGLGYIYNARKDYKAARQYFEDALKQEPGMESGNRPIALLGLGWVNENEQKDEEAVACYEGILKEEPSHVFALNGLAKIYIKQGKIKKAKEILFKSLKSCPNDNEAGELLKEIGT